jgi:acyl-CoA synthetase (AMP-forming)/AMP-acid ligase II
MPISVNVGGRLAAMAHVMPDATAVVEPLRYGRDGKRRYRKVTFRQLDVDSDRIAQGLRSRGVAAGTRLALLVRPGIDFVSLVFALFKAGVVVVLIDPGMGRRNLIRCLAEAEPDGFVAIPAVHAVRILVGRRFPNARFNVTVGRRWFWGGVTLGQLRAEPHPCVKPYQIAGPHELAEPHQDAELAATTADDPAAIIFTTGSTGPAKGVLFTHGNFDAQVDQIRDFYGIRPGEVDLPCFPMFGLFNCAMGVTAVIPDMDPSRPATVNPRKIVEAIDDWKVTQAFGSPAVWSRVGQYCREHGIKLRTVRRVLSAGAPIPAEVLEPMKACIHPEGDVHTPYGATEALPVASIAASEVLEQTAEHTRMGAGVCVGTKFPGIEWKVIRIVEGPIGALEEAEELPGGEVGELIVRGPVVTRRYVTRTEANALGKIRDGEAVWHRMGDAGYLGERGRFWYCGRVAHRVLTPDGPIYPVRCEAIFNQHPAVFRSAVVGVGPLGGQRPVAILEPVRGWMPRGRAAREALIAEVRQLGESSPLTAAIEDFLVHPAFPVDIRHNAKIFREKLAVWAATRLALE